MVESKKGDISGMGNYRNLIFFIPFLYAYRTRIAKSGRLGIVRFFAKYVVITFFFPFILNGGQLNVALYLLVLLFVYDFYEIGYIENDAETIKKETNPTLRLSSDQLLFYETNKYSIYGFRLALGIFFSLFLFDSFALDFPHSLAVYSIFLLMPLYFIYNRIRNVFTYIGYFLLLILRYLPIVLICLSSFEWWDAFFVVLIDPVPSLFIRLSSCKFGLKKKIVNKFLLKNPSYMNRFRSIYFLALVVVFAFLHIYKACFLPHLIVSLYFFLMSFFVWLKKGVVKVPDYLQSK